MSTGSDMGSLLRFRDQIRKETMALRKANARGSRPEFALPRNLKPCAPTIGSAPSGAALTEEQLATKRENVELLRSSLAASARAPRDRYETPLTSAMEVGWHATRLTNMAKPLYKATHSKSDVAEYGEMYVSAFGCGPYDKTQTMSR